MSLLTKKVSDVRQTIVRLHRGWNSFSGCPMIFKNKGPWTDPPRSRPSVVHVRPPCECTHNVTCTYAEKRAYLDSWLRLNHRHDKRCEKVSNNLPHYYRRNECAAFKTQQTKMILQTYSTCVSASAGKKKKKEKKRVHESHNFCLTLIIQVWFSLNLV